MAAVCALAHFVWQLLLQIVQFLKSVERVMFRQRAGAQAFRSKMRVIQWVFAISFGRFCV